MTDVLLVTGANSYVAGHIIQKALQRGFRVRGTVRSKASGDKLLAAFPAYTAGGDDAPLGYDVVADMTKPDSYASVFQTAAAAGHPITGIVHTASPFTLTIEDNERDMLLPARDGAVAILDAAQRYGGGAVRSVISVSSFAAVVDVSKGLRPGYVYSEADWNPISWDDAKASPSAAVAYCASKAHAERAQWDWIKAAQSTSEGVSFSLTTISPPWIFGPYVDPAALGIHSPAQLNESMKLLARLVDGSLAGGEVPTTDFAGFLDVRDLATITLAAYDRAGDPAVAGQRFLAGSKMSYQTCVDVIREAFPELRDKVPVGTPGAGRTEDTYALDSSKVRNTFGITLTPIEESVKDSVRQIISLA